MRFSWLLLASLLACTSARYQAPDEDAGVDAQAASPWVRTVSDGGRQDPAPGDAGQRDAATPRPPAPPPKPVPGELRSVAAPRTSGNLQVTDDGFERITVCTEVLCVSGGLEP